MFIVQRSPKAHQTLHQLPPCIGNHSFIVSSLWGECRAFSAAEAIHTEPNFHSTWYPLLLGGHSYRRSRFKACPRLSHMTSTAGIEPQTPWSWVQRLNYSAMRSNLPRMYLSVGVGAASPGGPRGPGAPGGPGGPGGHEHFSFAPWFWDRVWTSSVCRRWRDGPDNSCSVVDARNWNDSGPDFNAIF